MFTFPLFPPWHSKLQDMNIKSQNPKRSGLSQLRSISGQPLSGRVQVMFRWHSGLGQFWVNYGQPVTGSAWFKFGSGLVWVVL